MQTTLTGPMDSKMGEDVIKALERFAGLEIKVTIEVFTGRKPKAEPPNAHQPKKAPVEVADFNGEEDR
jgi:hypothetical protein